MRSLLRDDRGSLLLVHLFLVMAVVTAVTVIADAGSVIGARQELAATADQAAIAGAQAIDFDTYYAAGAESLEALPLDPDAAASAVRRYLAPAIGAGRSAGLALDAVTVSDGTITVRLSTRAALPFTSLLGIESVPVTASARARLLIQPGA